MTNPTPEQKAVALAEKHGQHGLRSALLLGHADAQWFLGALADHRQQIIEQLEKIADQRGGLSAAEIRSLK